MACAANRFGPQALLRTDIDLRISGLCEDAMAQKQVRVCVLCVTGVVGIVGVVVVLCVVVFCVDVLCVVCCAVC